MIDPEFQQGIEEMKERFDALVKVGFLRGEAILLMAAWEGRPVPASYPPEMIEFMAKQSRLAETVMDEMSQ